MNRTYFLLSIVVIMLSGGILSWYVYTIENHQPSLEIDFFSLTRGRSAFVRTPLNKTMLIGGGQTSETIREITRVMPFYKKKIDYLVIPSASPAQIGGLVEILDRYEFDTTIIPKLIATSTALDAVMKKVRKYKIHVREVERGDEIRIDEDVKMNILFPYEEFKFNKTSIPELAFSLSFESTSAYFMGNLSKTIQKGISKYISTSTNETIIEFYNTASESKVSPDLIEKLDPEFTFSTKEKTARAVSSGDNWEIIR